MIRTLLYCAVALTVFSSNALAQMVFTEDWDDLGGAGRWSAPVVEAETGVFDGTVDFAFDYSTLGVPPAPKSSGTTIGLFMEVNTTDDGDFDEGESVGVYATGFTMPAGDFFLTMDVFMNVNNLTNTETGVSPGGTTEYGSFGIFAAGAKFPGDAGVNDDVPFRFGLSNGDGLALQITGDGGAADDFFLFVDPGNADTGSQTGLGSFDDVPNGTIPGVPTGTGDPANPFRFGPEDQWVEVGITSSAGMISFSMNGYVIHTYDNTDGALSGGTIMLGYSDPFNSVNLDVGVETPNFILFDNVVMAIPEPSSVGMLICGIVGLLGVARRRR